MQTNARHRYFTDEDIAAWEDGTQLINQDEISLMPLKDHLATTCTNQHFKFKKFESGWSLIPNYDESHKQVLYVFIA